MGELRQHHPSLRISKVKALQKGDLLVVGDSPRDAVILQSEPKMKAALGKNVRVSLPKAYQTTKQKNTCLVVKGVPTYLTDEEFKEFLDLNKISYAKAERYKSKRDGRILPMFQLEISDPAEAEALLSQNLMCNVIQVQPELYTRWRNFTSQFRSDSASTVSVLVTRLKTVNPNKNASYVVRIIHTKDAQKKK